MVTDLLVLKKDWSKELYDRDKLKRALAIAFGKKHLSMDTVDEIVATLEAKRSGSYKEIESTQIWADVLAILKDMNEVAYVRFASVFREFDGLVDFWQFINKW